MEVLLLAVFKWGLDGSGCFLGPPWGVGLWELRSSYKIPEGKILLPIISGIPPP